MLKNIIFSLISRYKLKKYYRQNCIYSNIINFKKLQFKNILFILDNENIVHLGDFLFLLPIIKFLKEKYKCKLVIGNNHKLILKKISPDLLSLVERKKKIDNASLVITHSYMFDLYKKKNFIGIGLPTTRISIPYPEYLMKQILKFMKIKFNKNIYKRFIKDMRIKAKKSFDTSNKTSKFFLVSPYLGSGKFRDILKLKKKKIINTKNKYENLRFKSILIGSSSDNSNEKYFLDYRGKNLFNLMNLASSKNVIFGVGFDNFWMHYFDLIEKKYFTMFRGRFLKIIKDIHFNSINISFAKNKNVKKNNYLS